MLAWEISHFHSSVNNRFLCKNTFFFSLLQTISIKNIKMSVKNSIIVQKLVFRLPLVVRKRW